MVRKLILVWLVSINLAVKASALEGPEELATALITGSIELADSTIDQDLARGIAVYKESVNIAAKKLAEALETNNENIIIDALNNFKATAIQKVQWIKAGENVINGVASVTSEVKIDTINAINELYSSLVKNCSENGAKLSEQALEIAKNKIEIAKTLLESLAGQTSSVAKDVKNWADKNPDLAILAGLAGVLIGSAAIMALFDYWQANHRTINAKTLYTVADLIATLKDEGLSFGIRDRAFESLKKYTRYEQVYKNLYEYINGSKGLLNSYQEYKKYAAKKQQFYVAAEHIKTELLTNLVIYQA